MTTAHVPAWKKIGLKVQEELDEDPLAITTHLESASITNKQAKKINKQKRKLDQLQQLEASGNKKAPKRLKLPKSERPPPPERDQLVYLRQYHNDRDNWKFSKQKQNWILKNIGEIPADYESSLVVYLEGLQGNSRARLLSDLKEVVAKWNQIIEEAEARVDAELNGDKTDNETKDDQLKEKPKKKVEQDSAPTHDLAVRCRKLIRALSDEIVVLKGVDDAEQNDISEDENQQQKADDIPRNQQKADSEEVPRNQQEADGDDSEMPGNQSDAEVKGDNETPHDQSNIIIDDIEVGDLADDAQIIKGSNAEHEAEDQEQDEDQEDSKKSKKSKKKPKKQKKSKKSKK